MTGWSERFADLFIRHRKQLEKLVERRVRDREAAADIVQDVFERVFASGGAGSEEADARTLFVAARNASINYSMRRSRRWRALSRLAPEQISPAPASEHDRLEAREAMSALETALKRLPPRAREIFVRRRLLGHSNAEIARDLGISARAVEKSLAQTLKRCRAALEDHLNP